MHNIVVEIIQIYYRFYFLLFQELSLHQDRVRSMCLTDEGLVISGPGSRDGRIAVWKSHLSEERPAIQRFSHERPRRPKQIRREVTVCDEEDGFELVCRK